MNRLRWDCRIVYEPSFYPPARARTLFDALGRQLEWEQRAIVLFGRRVMQPRLISWAGELPYRYSGQTLEPRPYVTPLSELVSEVSEAAGVRFNHVLLNRYRDGADAMGWHADDEPELGVDPPVATLTLGHARRFLLRPKSAPERKQFGAPLEFELEAGGLLLMLGVTQRHYVHAVPKQPNVTGERISLTLRRVLRAPPRPLTRQSRNEE